MTSIPTKAMEAQRATAAISAELAEEAKSEAELNPVSVRR